MNSVVTKESSLISVRLLNHLTQPKRSIRRPTRGSWPEAGPRRKKWLASAVMTVAKMLLTRLIIMPITTLSVEKVVINALLTQLTNHNDHGLIMRIVTIITQNFNQIPFLFHINLSTN